MSKIVKNLRTLSIDSRHLSYTKDLRSMSALYQSNDPKEKNTKVRIIIILLFAIALTSSITLMVASFLPIYVDTQFPGAINLTLTGLIIR